MGIFRKTFYACAATYVVFSYNPQWTRRKFGPLPLEPLTLHPPSRAECLKMLASSSQEDQALDVLVVGGGASGAGVALDASIRGLRVGLVEMNDYASGTSSRSTKLIHGGIRYLEKAVMQLSYQQLKLVTEALSERAVMLHQAPHLCRPLRTIIPCYGVHDSLQFTAGVMAYDVLAALNRGTIEFSNLLEHREIFKLMPVIKVQSEYRQALNFAATYFDGQMDDARVCLSAVLTAACYGAATVNHCKLLRAELRDDGLLKVTLRDQRCQADFSVITRSIVNCSGAFSDDVRRAISPETASSVMRPSSGTHVVLPAKFCPPEGNALIVPSSDGRVIFSCPFQGKCIAGTTDNPCTVSDSPTATKDEVKFILKNLSEYVTETLTPADVLSCWNGIRPLAIHEGESGATSTENIVREHVISRDKLMPSVLHMTGGKWTTYRKMAEECVDRLMKEVLGKPAGKCVTSETLLIGAHGLAEASQRQANPAVPADTHRYWLAAYGDRWAEVEELALATEDGMSRLHPEFPVVRGEVLYAARHEHCETVEDFLSRRCRMSFLNATAAKASVSAVASVLAKEKKWSRSQHSAEESAALATINREFFAH
jgi:glycerol-3-phosphate dehydrogenase